LEPRGDPSDRFLQADAALQVSREWEMIEFLAMMPTSTKISLTTAVLGLMASLIVLRGLI
jgi:hypothetical protein